MSKVIRFFTAIFAIFVLCNQVFASSAHYGLANGAKKATSNGYAVFLNNYSPYAYTANFTFLPSHASGQIVLMPYPQYGSSIEFDVLYPDTSVCVTLYDSWGHLYDSWCPFYGYDVPPYGSQEKKTH